MAIKSCIVMFMFIAISQSAFVSLSGFIFFFVLGFVFYFLDNLYCLCGLSRHGLNKWARSGLMYAIEGYTIGSVHR